MIAECPGCKLRYDVSGRPAGTRAQCRCGTTFVLPVPAANAAALNCPQCGAGSAPDQPSCGYCHAVLAKVACPRCFGMIYQGAKHCAHCGADVGIGARPIEEATKVQPCPRCGPLSDGLVAHIVGETLLDVCGRCAGLWMDLDAFKRITEERDRGAALLALGIGGQAAVVTEAKVSYIPCPACTRIMNRTNFGRRSGVVIDVCKAHGVWFDKDELRRVLEFVQAGGLEIARERQMQELREQQTAARQATRMAERANHGHVEPHRPNALDFMQVLATLLGA